MSSDFVVEGRRRRALRWLGFFGVLGVVGVVLVVLLVHGSAEVSAGSLPLVEGGGETRTFVTCTNILGLDIFASSSEPDTPCETFVLVSGHGFRSQAALLAAEDRTLLLAGWRHPSISPATDYYMATVSAPVSMSWYSPGHKVCAYVTTDRAGISAARRDMRLIGPEQGLPAFVRLAEGVIDKPVLWVRLCPRVDVQPAAC